jgi:hypothetical protein
MGNLGVGMTTPAYPVDISNATYDRGINVLNSYSDNVDFTGVYSSSKSGVDGYGKGIISIGGL